MAGMEGAAGIPAVGTCRRPPHAGHGFLMPASIAGDSSGSLHRGHLYLTGGSTSPSIVFDLAAIGVEGDGVAGIAADGTANNSPHFGHLTLRPAALCGVPYLVLHFGHWTMNFSNTMNLVQPNFRNRIIHDSHR